ncbi:MAG: recombinase family protein [Ruminococcus sp.]|nr:recombinase family protein [Ruminococcus sp.]
MARKKFYTNAEENVQAEKTNAWNTALYIRLSRMDGDNLESDSVVNQRRLLNDYIDEHEELLSIEEFIDDDWTGTNFDRPAFQRMMQEIQKGNINCVIVKDLSRFGRNYIEAGKYLEHILPSYNCRIISVIDELDSFKDTDAALGLMVRIKNLIHDQNSQEISKKVRETKNMLRREGKYISPPPFGYLRDPNDRYKLIVDEEAAVVVRKIFSMYLNGMGTIRIAQKLNELGIVTRADYQKTGSIYKSDSSGINDYCWRPNSVRDMLSNKVYIGAVAQHRRTTRNYKDRKAIYLEEKDHIIVYDMHQPIVEKDQFYKVQDMLKNRCTKTSPNCNELYLFSGMLRCASCNSSMIRNPKLHNGKWYVYYKCRGYNQGGKGVCEHSHSITEEKLTAAVEYALNIQIKTLIDIKRVIQEINSSRAKQRLSIDYDKLIREKTSKKENLKAMKLNSYMDWKNGVVSKEDYIFMRDKFDSHMDALSKEILSLENEKLAEEDIRSNQFSWLERLIKSEYLDELTREITTDFIDFIYVGMDQKIRIVFKYKDEYDRLVEYIEKHSQTSYTAQGGV